MSDRRVQQVGYSELQPEMHAEAGRRRKGRKVGAVLCHFLGSRDLAERWTLDLGSSTGFISDELRSLGAHVVGVDIDVPGVTEAHRRFPEQRLVVAAGESLPFPADHFDVAVFNHIYEHTLDPVAVMREIRRVLRPQGVVYLGLANRLFPVEPHTKLPFLSYLPANLADRYVRLTRRGDHYHERLRTPAGLRRMCGGLDVWDYTQAVLAQPSEFSAEEDLGRIVSRIPRQIWQGVDWLVPTYLWVGVKGRDQPRGPSLDVAPQRVSTPSRAA